MELYAPYRNCEVEVMKECGLSRFDNVERAGYIRPEDRIKTFIETGQLLQSSALGGEYDIQGTETDSEPDSPEYVEELEKEAEDFNEAPLAQYMDKLTASEILAEADRELSNASKSVERDKTRKTEKDASKEFLEALKKEVSAGVSEAIANKTKSAE